MSATAPVKTLDMNKINALRSGSGKKRGMHPALILEALRTQVPYIILNEHPAYKHFDADALKSKKQGIQQAIDKSRLTHQANNVEFPDLQVIWDDDEKQLWLLNNTMIEFIEANPSTDEDESDSEDNFDGAGEDE